MISVLLKTKEPTIKPKMDYKQLPNIWNKQLSPCVPAQTSLQTPTLLSFCFSLLPKPFSAAYSWIIFWQNNKSMGPTVDTPPG